ncbi:MAG TPA: sugar ABC transporter substrate-binding protein [Acidimicrobiales bacterium]|nr:sugar ABC transporter substrate-binding protein [Acidimicrobiales bacterium]
MSRRALAWAAVVAVATASAACGGGSGGDGPTTIRVQVSGEPEETAVHTLMAEAFEKQNPDIRVRVDRVATKSDHLAKLATAFAGGEPPDVFLVNYREYSQFVTRGAVLPIGPHLASTGIDFDQYYPTPMDAFSVDGTLQCAPSNASSAVVFYNKLLLARAGLQPPAAGWTWSTLAAYAKATTGGGLHGLGIEPSIVRVAPFVWSAGGDIVDDSDRPTRLTLGTPAARRALDYLTGLVHDAVVPSEQDVAAQSLEERFAAGKLAMLITSRRDVPGFREVATLDFDVAPLPVAERPAGILHSDGFCVSRRSEHRDEALRFVRFAIGPEGQTLGALSGRIVPVLRSVAAGPFLDPTRRPEHGQVFLDQLAVARATPVVPTWPEIETVVEELLTRLFYEPGYSLDHFLDEADRQTRPLLEEAAAERAPSGR